MEVPSCGFLSLQRGDWTEQEKNAAAIHEEVAQEGNRFLGLVFAQRHKDGRTDLQAVEPALRAALHQAGAAAELLKLEVPAAEQLNASIVCFRSGTLTKPPRRIAFSVNSLNQRSTKFSQLELFVFTLHLF